jgi:hypothetical protein
MAERYIDQCEDVDAPTGNHGQEDEEGSVHTSDEEFLADSEEDEAPDAVHPALLQRFDAERQGAFAGRDLAEAALPSFRQRFGRPSAAPAASAASEETKTSSTELPQHEESKAHVAPAAAAAPKKTRKRKPRSPTEWAITIRDMKAFQAFLDDMFSAEHILTFVLAVYDTEDADEDAGEATDADQDSFQCRTGLALRVQGLSDHHVLIPSGSFTVDAVEWGPGVESFEDIDVWLNAKTLYESLRVALAGSDASELCIKGDLEDARAKDSITLVTTAMDSVGDVLDPKAPNTAAVLPWQQQAAAAQKQTTLSAFMAPRPFRRSRQTLQLNVLQPDDEEFQAMETRLVAHERVFSVPLLVKDFLKTLRALTKSGFKYMTVSVSLGMTEETLAAFSSGRDMPEAEAHLCIVTLDMRSQQEMMVSENTRNLPVYMRVEGGRLVSVAMYKGSLEAAVKCMQYGQLTPAPTDAAAPDVLPEGAGPRNVLLRPLWSSVSLIARMAAALGKSEKSPATMKLQGCVDIKELPRDETLRPWTAAWANTEWAGRGLPGSYFEFALDARPQYIVLKRVEKVNDQLLNVF